VTITLDPDLLAAARALPSAEWQRLQTDADWQRLQTDHPEIAELARDPEDVRLWRRLDEECDRREARKCGLAPYTFYDVTRDAKGAGSPKSCAPYECWRDRQRWYRRRGAQPDAFESAPSDGASAALNEIEGGLLDLHLVTDGGYSVSKIATSPHLLERCRLCLRPLDGSREPGGQLSYCDGGCKREMKNARARSLRAAIKGRVPTDAPVPPRVGRTLRQTAERFARRWRTTAAPAPPKLRADWDSRRCGYLISVNGNAWRITLAANVTVE
jgi:hypothetical protein